MLTRYMFIITADNACSSRPCLNMGQCVALPNNDYTCVCPVLYTAKDCSQGETYHSYFRMSYKHKVNFLNCAKNHHAADV